MSWNGNQTGRMDKHRTDDGREQSMPLSQRRRSTSTSIQAVTVYLKHICKHASEYIEYSRSPGVKGGFLLSLARSSEDYARWRNTTTWLSLRPR